MDELESIFEADTLKLGLQMTEAALAPHQKGTARTTATRRKIEAIKKLMKREDL